MSKLRLLRRRSSAPRESRRSSIQSNGQPVHYSSNHPLTKVLGQYGSQPSPRGHRKCGRSRSMSFIHGQELSNNRVGGRLRSLSVDASLHERLQLTRTLSAKEEDAIFGGYIYKMYIMLGFLCTTATILAIYAFFFNTSRESFMI